MTTKEQADQNLLFEDLKKSISDLSAHLWRIDELELQAKNREFEAPHRCQF
jgi:hypothetical protein